VLNSLALADLKKRNAAKLEEIRIEELKAEVIHILKLRTWVF